MRLTTHRRRIYRGTDFTREEAARRNELYVAVVEEGRKICKICGGENFCTIAVHCAGCGKLHGRFQITKVPTSFGCDVCGLGQRTALQAPNMGSIAGNNATGA